VEENFCGERKEQNFSSDTDAGQKEERDMQGKKLGF